MRHVSASNRLPCLEHRVAVAFVDPTAGCELRPRGSTKPIPTRVVIALPLHPCAPFAKYRDTPVSRPRWRNPHGETAASDPTFSDDGPNRGHLRRRRSPPHGAATCSVGSWTHRHRRPPYQSTVTGSLCCRCAGVAHSRDALDGTTKTPYPALVRVRGAWAVAEHRNGGIGLADRSACPIGDTMPHLIVRLVGSVEVAIGDHSVRAYRSEKTIAALAYRPVAADRHHRRIRTVTHTGHRAEALAQCERSRTTLSEHRGLEPSRRATGPCVACWSPRHSPRNGEPGERAEVHRGTPARRLVRSCRT